MVLEVTSYATTHKQVAKTTVVVACLVLACDWTPCVPFVIQVLRVFYSYPSTLHYHYRGLFIYVKAYWGLNYSVNKKINVYLPSFIARTTVNRCQSSVVDFEPDYVTRQGQGENQARNCSRKRLWGEPEHVTIDNRRRRNLAQPLSIVGCRFWTRLRHSARSRWEPGQKLLAKTTLGGTRACDNRQPTPPKLGPGEIVCSLWLCFPGHRTSTAGRPEVRPLLIEERNYTPRR